MVGGISLIRLSKRVYYTNAMGGKIFSRYLFTTPPINQTYGRLCRYCNYGELQCNYICSEVRMIENIDYKDNITLYDIKISLILSRLLIRRYGENDLNKK